MGIVVVQVIMQILFALCLFTICCCYCAIPHSDPIEQGISAGSNAHFYQEEDRRKIIDAKGGPEDVVWVVQLSDLHFSVHHPERARDFRDFVGSSLSFVNPSLVLITGDLTDGKSKDLLTMKQDEAEWVEYEKVMQNVIEKSGLNKDIFYDLRGNHDAFGVPSIGSLFDFFSKHSINGQLGRSGQVNSVTVQTAIRKILFVGFDSTMSVGLRGPTNLFGHPTDELLAKIDYELSQWNSDPTKPVTKISFGHFPLSFSAASDSGKTLRDTFLKHSVSAYLCGHLHTSFGKNLKRHHYSSDNLLASKKFFQLNPRQKLSHNAGNCSNGAPTFKEFWEWEMGDWRKSRNMRILAVDRGFLSFVDIDFKLGAYSTIRTLVFSASPVVSVVVRIYDSRPGNLIVLESSMKRHDGGTFSRGDLYLAPWNFEAFEDPSPDRYWLQIEATDIMGRSTLTALRPFSINGLTARLSWTWKEFMVMGCQWDALYYPILWSFYLCTFSILIIPKLMFVFSPKHYSYRNFIAKKSLINGMAWVFKEFYTVPLLWLGIVVYLFYLLLCPWLLGEVFTEGGEKGFMTFKGWVLKFNKIGKVDFIGVPDIMVVVLPHLFFVILPSIFVTGALAVERGIYRDRFLSLSGKKEDDHIADNNESGSRISGSCRNGKSSMCIDRRGIRNIVLVASLAIFWKHFKSCRTLVKAYDMNPFLHFPVYSLTMPVLLAYVIYKTGRM